VNELIQGPGFQTAGRPIG